MKIIEFCKFYKNGVTSCAIFQKIAIALALLLCTGYFFRDMYKKIWYISFSCEIFIIAMKMVFIFWKIWIFQTTSKKLFKAVCSRNCTLTRAIALLNANGQKKPVLPFWQLPRLKILMMTEFLVEKSFSGKVWSY